MKQVEPASSLIARAPVGNRHPALVGGLWFGAAGAVTGALTMVGFIIVSGSITSGALDMLQCIAWAFVISGLSGMIPGAVLGPRILLKPNLTDSGASWWGAAIGVASNFMVAMLAGLACAIGTFVREGTIAMWTFLLIAPLWIGLGGLLSTLLTGVVTVPAAMIAGQKMYERREKLLGRGGCRVHGYRDQPCIEQKDG